MDKTRIIKDTLSIKQVAKDYGIRLNRAGKASCPFHIEKTPSLSFNEKRRLFKCFGCDASGDVITLTMKIFNISFQQAIIRLSHDYKLHISDEQPDFRSSNDLRRKQREERRKNGEWNSKAEELKQLRRRFFDLKPNEPFEELRDEFIEVMNAQNKLEEWLLENL